jgi:hypothetical protein
MTLIAIAPLPLAETEGNLENDPQKRGSLRFAAMTPLSIADDQRFIRSLRLKIRRNKERSKRFLLPDSYRSRDGRRDAPT